MSDRLAFVRFPVLLLFLFFLGKLIVGALGGSYELGVRLFAMVPLTVHLALAWGAVARAFKGEKAGGAFIIGALIALAAQILIFLGTMGSYLLGVETHFSNPVAIVGEQRPVSLGEALVARSGGLVINALIGGVAALIGWTLGGLIPRRE